MMAYDALTTFATACRRQRRNEREPRRARRLLSGAKWLPLAFLPSKTSDPIQHPLWQCTQPGFLCLLGRRKGRHCSLHIIRTRDMPTLLWPSWPNTYGYVGERHGSCSYLSALNVGRQLHGCTSHRPMRQATQGLVDRTVSCNHGPHMRARPRTVRANNRQKTC